MLVRRRKNFQISIYMRLSTCDMNSNNGVILSSQFKPESDDDTLEGVANLSEPPLQTHLEDISLW